MRQHTGLEQMSVISIKSDLIFYVYIMIFIFSNQIIYFKRFVQYNFIISERATFNFLTVRSTGN